MLYQSTQNNGDVMTFDEALAELKTNGRLTSDLLGPLNISFEFFLKLGQLKEPHKTIVVRKLIDKLDKKEK